MSGETQIGATIDQVARPMQSSPKVHASLALLALSFVLAEPARGQITAGEYAARRDSLAARIGDGFVVAFGGRTPVTDFGTFFQLPAFEYLTGYDEPDAALVVVARGGRATTT